MAELCDYVAGLGGPCVPAVLIKTRSGARRGALAAGATTTMALQYGYTQIKPLAQNAGVSASIIAVFMSLFCLIFDLVLLHDDKQGSRRNVCYGTIHAYTPEIPNSAHRLYVNRVVLNREGGLIGVVVGSYVSVRVRRRCSSMLACLACLSTLVCFYHSSRARKRPQ